MLETQRQGLVAHLRELVGVVVALHRQMLGRRSQVLTESQDVAVDRAQVEERLM
jgi:hypothetical protein